MSSVNSKSNRLWMFLSIIVVVILVIYIIINPPGQNNETALVEVNGVSISKDQLYDTMYNNGGAEALQVLIENELINQEAEKLGIVVKDEDIESEIEKIKQGFYSEEEFTEALAYYGMTLDSMKKDLVVHLQMEKVLEPQITITDEQIEEYYTNNLESIKTPEEIKASHILLAAQAEADTVLAQLNNGADFAELAQEKSIDTLSKDNGGDLGLIPKGTMDEQFETAAFALEIGKLSGVVQSNEGFHIIKVMARNAEIVPTLEEKSVDIREQLLSDEVNTLGPVWLEEKKAESSIKMF